MEVSDQVRSALKSADPSYSSIVKSLEFYPTGLIDLLIFHRLHFHLEPAQAVKTYNALQSEFVGWNEIRVSPIREIQEQVRKAHDSLELSVYIKDLLEFIQGDRHCLLVEPILEENLTDIRRYLKKIRNIDPSSVELALLLRKEHPIVPLSEIMEEALTADGVTSDSDSRDRKQKSLFDMVGRDAALAAHHVAIENCRQAESADDVDFSGLYAFLSALPDSKFKAPKKKKKKAKKKAPAKTAAKKKTAKKTAKKKAAK